MRVYTRVVYDFVEGRYVLVAENSRMHLGKIALVKGATNDQRMLSNSFNQFYKTLVDQQQKAFGNQQAVFSGIRKVYDAIVAAGPGQFGLTKPEETALRTQASEATAGQSRQAQRATAESLASAGGGDTFLPSGVSADIKAKQAGQAAALESGRQLDITKTGYDIGRQQFQNATNVELGIASGYNPLGYAGAATGAGGLAGKTASEIQAANQAASPWGTIGGLVGGAVGAFANPASFATSKMGGFLGNAGTYSDIPQVGAPSGYTAGGIS